MLRYIHQLSAFLFYTFGLSFFAAYILVRNGYGGMAPSIWLQVADLPFALCAILYGGLSLYLSLQHPSRSSKALQWSIGIPLGLLLVVLVILNFWGMWPFNG